MATKTTKIDKTTSKIKTIKTATASAKPATVKAAKPAAPAANVRRVTVTSAAADRRGSKLAQAGPQFSYMKAPGVEHVFEVGDTVEVFCDHEKNNDRVRGWIKGIVVQVDNKMVAVQFRSNVFLTDGWMVPDRILWYPLTSDQIRATGAKKTSKKDFIPEY